MLQLILEKMNNEVTKNCVHGKNIYGETPIHLAAKRGCDWEIKYLKKKGWLPFIT